MKEATRQTERVVEEFRRYKVRTEITLKQKALEAKPAISLQSSQARNALSIGGTGLSAALDKALSTGHISPSTHQNNNDDSSHESAAELARLRSQLAETESKWRMAYEKLAKELETLKNKGAESVVAAQWRSRYELSVKDKQELEQKLELLMQLSDEVTSNGTSVEQMLLELEDDYKVRRVFITMLYILRLTILILIEFAQTSARNGTRLQGKTRPPCSQRWI